MSITIRINGVAEAMRELEQRGENARDVLERMTTAAAQVIVELANGYAPGPHMTSKTTRKTDDVVEVSVFPDDDHWYYIFFERGTRAHVIVPKEAKALMFAGRFARRVNHPGMAARPFLRPAKDAGSDAARAAFAEQLRGVIDGG